jgi:hypothetical protein
MAEQLSIADLSPEAAAALAEFLAERKAQEERETAAAQSELRIGRSA